MLKFFRNKFFISAACLALAGVLALGLLPRLYEEKTSFIKILKLVQTVEPGTVVTGEMLATVEVGAYGLPGNVITNLTDLVGLVAADTVYAGEYLWREHFMTMDEFEASKRQRLSGLSDGMYLLTISLPEASSGIAGILRAGYIVDVYGFMDDSGTIAVNEELSSVNVYKVFNSKLQSLDDLDIMMESNPGTTPSDYDFIPTYIVFIVNEQQAKTLIRLEKAKTLHLTLREAGD